jgi:hypothetical protein
VGKALKTHVVLAQLPDSVARREKRTALNLARLDFSFESRVRPC